MKISYNKNINANDIKSKVAIAINGRLFCTFKICKSILKNDFKSLMQLTKNYDAKQKSGFIKESDKEEFIKLCEKIEKSDDNKCENSHQKSAKKYLENKIIRKCEHEDLGSLGYRHGDTVSCPHCGERAQVW